jgi:hypothetical protein
MMPFDRFEAVISGGAFCRTGFGGSACLPPDFLSSDGTGARHRLSCSGRFQWRLAAHPASYRLPMSILHILKRRRPV